MKTPETPKDMPGKEDATNPKKPNNDPDQTPEKETNDAPRANPSKNDPYKKSKIGYNK